MTSQLSQMLNTCAAKSPGNLGNHTNLAFFGGWAVGRGVYWPRKRSIWIAIALEIFAARPCPSLCEIRKATSISSFEHVSEKKGTPSPRPRQQSRPRFSDPSFLQQLWVGERGERRGMPPSDLLCWLTVIWSGALTDSLRGRPHTSATIQFKCEKIIIILLHGTYVG